MILVKFPEKKRSSVLEPEEGKKNRNFCKLTMFYGEKTTQTRTPTKTCRVTFKSTFSFFFIHMREVVVLRGRKVDPHNTYGQCGFTA